jgi:hypothetical protein
MHVTRSWCKPHIDVLVRSVAQDKADDKSTGYIELKGFVARIHPLTRHHVLNRCQQFPHMRTAAERADTHRLIDDIHGMAEASRKVWDPELLALFIVI